MLLIIPRSEAEDDLPPFALDGEFIGRVTDKSWNDCNVGIIIDRENPISGPVIDRAVEETAARSGAVPDNINPPWIPVCLARERFAPSADLSSDDARFVPILRREHRDLCHRPVLVFAGCFECEFRRSVSDGTRENCGTIVRDDNICSR
jgi:hypothetical protein